MKSEALNVQRVQIVEWLPMRDGRNMGKLPACQCQAYTVDSRERGAFED